MISKAKILTTAILLVLTIGALLLIGKETAIKHTNTNDSVEASSPTLNKEASKPKGETPAAKEVQAVNSKNVQVTALASDLNDYVLKIIPNYKGRTFPYLLNNDYENYNGVTENIVYRGSLIAKANPDGSKSSHCVGLTYEVFFKAMRERNKEAGLSQDNFNNMTADNMKDFLLTWYAAKSTPKSAGNQMAGAIVKYGLGYQIKKLEEAKTGDFIDFSRTKSGHTAVFIGWLRDNKGSIVGFRYWSTQDSTNGIGYREEYFSDNLSEAFKGTVNRNQLYIGRVGAISGYKAF